VLIATRKKTQDGGACDGDGAGTVADAGGDDRPGAVFGIYMPNLKAKIPYWEALIEASTPHAGGRALALGDFNTCRAYVDETGATDVTALFLDQIQAAGFAMCGATGFRRGASSRGTAIAAMDFGSITRLPRRGWREASGKFVTRIWSGSAGCRITRRCWWKSTRVD